MSEIPNAINVRLPSSVEATTEARLVTKSSGGVSKTSQYRMPSLSFLGTFRKTPQVADSVRKIEQCWINYRNRQMFRLLKTAVVAAEHSLTKEIMRKIAPKEAVFFKDDNSINFRIRFRFGGADFPPNIYFKIYVAPDSGCVLKYMNGRKYISATSEAAEDALQRMGSRLYYGQLLRDSMLHSDNRVVDEFEIATLKDYMQYSSLLDETPAGLGGKENAWRRLSLGVLPRRTVFHDLVAYMSHKQVSPRLRRVLPFLLARPLSPEMAREQLRLIVEVWPEEERQAKAERSAAARHLLTNRSQETARRSRNAMLRAEKMRRAFTSSPSVGKAEPSTADEQGLVVAAPSRGEAMAVSQQSWPEEEEEEEEMEEEIGTLYQWTRELTLDDMVRTPRLPSDRPSVTPNP